MNRKESQTNPWREPIFKENKIYQRKENPWWGPKGTVIKSKLRTSRECIMDTKQGKNFKKEINTTVNEHGGRRKRILKLIYEIGS